MKEKTYKYGVTERSKIYHILLKGKILTYCDMGMFRSECTNTRHRGLRMCAKCKKARAKARKG